MSGTERNFPSATLQGVEESPRLFATPRARRIARDRKLNLAHVRGSGPRGRIIASDVEPVPVASPPRNDDVRLAALGTELDTTAIEAMIDTFAKRSLTVDIDDVVVRATSAALVSTYEPGRDSPAAVSLELADRTVRFDGASTMALSTIRAIRLAHTGPDQSRVAPALSIRIVEAGSAPIFLSPLPGLEMRLAIATSSEFGGDTRATLFFNETRIAIEQAVSMLKALKQGLEQPLLLL